VFLGLVFLPLSVQLLHNLKIRAADSNDTLMRVLKSNVTQHIPLGCDVIGLEVDAELIDTYDLPARLEGVIAPRSAGEGEGGGGSSSSSSSGTAGEKKSGKKRMRAEVEIGGGGGGGGGAGGGSGSGGGGGAAGTVAAARPKDVAFVIGAMSHGNISPTYITRTFSLSRYPLSAACTVGKLMNAYERAWGVL
jgi:rRNA pseudouridine-1189 N-methylase Emg1 (Nep1/Mra1 family)